MAESGLAGMEYNGGWYGLVAPTGTPKAIIDRLNTEISKAMKSPAVLQQAKGLNMDPVGSNADEFADFMNGQFKKFAEIAKTANIQVE